MIQPTIPLQNCRKCGEISGTKIICDECFPTLTNSQIQTFDTEHFQPAVIELFGNECVDCGHSAETASGELCADHLETKGAHTELRYDLANAVCRCMTCHNKRHDGNVKKVPPSHKMPKETQEKQEKFKKLPVCKIAGCPAWAMGPKFPKPACCGRHQ